MITKVEARTPDGDVLVLSLDAEVGILVQEINGLDPVKASITSSKYATSDGGRLQSTRRDARNITMKLGLEPDYVVDSVRELRTRLYGFFMPEAQVSLRFYMIDGLTVDIQATVESFDSPMFTKTPTVDISLLCFEPDFLATTPTVVSGNTVSGTSETLLQYPGSSETGFEFKLNLNRSLSAFTIYCRAPNGSISTFDFAASLVSGDVLTFSTVDGNKSVILRRSGVDSSLLYAMSSQSSWLKLFPGDNHIRVYATGAAIPYTLTYTARYGGL